MLNIAFFSQYSFHISLPWTKLFPKFQSVKCWDTTMQRDFATVCLLPFEILPSITVIITGACTPARASNQQHPTSNTFPSQGLYHLPGEKKSGCRTSGYQHTGVFLQMAVTALTKASSLLFWWMWQYPSYSETPWLKFVCRDIPDLDKALNSET